MLKSRTGQGSVVGSGGRGIEIELLSPGREDGRGGLEDALEEIELFGQALHQENERVSKRELVGFCWQKLVEQTKAVLPVCVFLGGFQVNYI